MSCDLTNNSILVFVLAPVASASPSLVSLGSLFLLPKWLKLLLYFLFPLLFFSGTFWSFSDLGSFGILHWHVWKIPGVPLLQSLLHDHLDSWYHRMPSKRKLRSHLIVFITRESFFSMTNHRKGKYKQHSKIFPQFLKLWLLSNAPTPERVKTLFWVVGNKVIFVILLDLCNGGLPYATWKCRQMTVNNCRTLHSDIEHLYPLVKGRVKAYPL